MKNIRLPIRFEKKLSEDQFLEGVIKMTISRFSDIYKDNKLYFFEEYTDHGIDHIEKVIASSDNLITDNTFEVLSSNDIGYYILSVLLHDIGMHINLAGFNCLINGEFDKIRIKELDKKTWRESWLDFLNVAKRYSGKMLKSIFGNENTVIRLPPLENANEINGYDRKLIGEFLRKNHARLAHEIAIYGFPGISGPLEFAGDLDIRTRNMVGLIARSHGVDLRTCLDYIETEYGRNNRRFPNNTHATYLMVLLRLADYIQIDPTRTSTTLIKTKKFSSPISEMEHNAHISIHTIDDKYQDDPEKIHVEASPSSSQMYLKIKKLIRDIQYEFDMSWAVLGELYGRIARRPEIKYRRITSNLGDESFISKQAYVADAFSFKANDEIVKLLIAPLYGDDPKYGIRELLQNSIDACEEREKIKHRKENKKYIPQVRIEIIHQELPLFTISDNGIGMDVDVIKNYFLKAGASYRKSMEWQKEYLNEKGRSTVQRSGRFGIGILAAFLIGKEIIVETKKMGNDVGYIFSADLNTDQINILKDPSINEGTKISVTLSDDVLKKLEPIKKENTYNPNIQWFEWFSLVSPSIKYFYLGNELLSSKNLTPGLNDPLSKEWSAIDSNGFNKILWKHSSRQHQPEITCNGIIIPDATQSANRLLDLGLISNKPDISVFDYDAFLPLTLNRNEFSNKIPFAQDLKESLYKDYIAYMLTFKDVSTVAGNIIYLNEQQLSYPGTRNRFSYENFIYGFNVYNSRHLGGQLLEKILVSKKGFIIDYNYFIRKLNKVNTIFIQSEDIIPGDIDIELDLQDNFLYFSDNAIRSITDYQQAIEPRVYDHEKNELNLYNSRIFLKENQYEYLFEPTMKRTSVNLKQRIEIKYKGQKWIGFNLDHGPKMNSLISDTFLKNYGDKLNFIREYEIECPFEGDETLNALLTKYIGDDVLIPFSIEEREKKFPLAFRELAQYMEKYPYPTGRLTLSPSQ